MGGFSYNGLNFKVFFVKMFGMQYLRLGRAFEGGIYKFAAGVSGVDNAFMRAKNLLSEGDFSRVFAVSATFFYVF